MTSSGAPHDHPASPGGYFEPEAWEERYSGENEVWSGRPNPQLVQEVSDLDPGRALDVGCGEGGDLIWLARHGWKSTGVDFSANGLRRARRHADSAGVGDMIALRQVDARSFRADGEEFDLVTTHYLHPEGGGWTDLLARLTEAVAPGGHLLVVGHAPSAMHPADGPQARAMFLAADLLPAVPDGFEVLRAEQRPRSREHEGRIVEIEDSVLHLQRLQLPS